MPSNRNIGALPFDAGDWMRGDPVPHSVSLSADANGTLVLEQELALRWRLSVRTLQRWRLAGSGPVFLRLGRRIAYRLSDIERFETAHAHVGGRP